MIQMTELEVVKRMAHGMGMTGLSVSHANKVLEKEGIVRNADAARLMATIVLCDSKGETENDFLIYDNKLYTKTALIEKLADDILS